MSSKSLDNIHTIYRISDAGYVKKKVQYAGKLDCLKNFRQYFGSIDTLIMDNVESENREVYSEGLDINNVFETSLGNAASFLYALDKALVFPDETIIYFVEDDYIHRRLARQALLEGIKLADFVTLYDHPDKHPVKPEIKQDLSDWYYTHSTTMTFAARVETLKKVETIIRKWCAMQHPHDHYMFLEFLRNGYRLISPTPGFSTHTESNLLAPGIEWEKHIKSTYL